MGHLVYYLKVLEVNLNLKVKSKVKKNNYLNDSKLLEELGVFAIVLGIVETSTAKLITKSIKIPTIGIGSSVFVMARY